MGMYEDLVEKYDQEKQRLDNGEEVNTLELMFIGYTLDAVDTAMRNFKIQLDFSEDSIKDVERILDALNKTIPIDRPSNEMIMKFAKQFSGYIGQVMINIWGGLWMEEDNYPLQNGPGLRIGNTDIFLLSKVYRRITMGSEENIFDFYQLTKRDLNKSHNEL